MATDIDLRPAGANIFEVAGADLSLVITCVDAAGDAVDVSGYTFAADVLRAGTSVESFATAVSGAGSNILTLTLTDTETAAIGTGRGLEWALKVTTGGVDDWWYAGAFQLWEPGKPRPSSSSNTLTAVVGGSITATLTVGIAGSGLTSVDVPDDLNTTGTASSSTFLRGDGAWAAPAGGGDLLAANNLSDLANAGTARTNLGLGTAATAATGDFATTFYVDASAAGGGNGAASTPWNTLAQVNGASLPKGGAVVFARGGVFRESLVPQDGVTYRAAEGSGPKPSVRGSDVLSGVWTSEGGGVYYKGGISTDPVVFTHDGIIGQRKTAKVSLTADWDYWWDDPNDRLYVYHGTGDPDGQADLLEYAVRTAIAGNFVAGVEPTYIGLDFRHDRGAVMFGSFVADRVTVADCDFSFAADYFFQFNSGSIGSGGGSFTNCTFTDWGVGDGQDYAIQSIGPAGTTALPCYVNGCTFTINHSANSTEIGAFMCDQNGWLREFNDNVCDGTAGQWARDMVSVWKPGSAATDISILRNTLTAAGGVAILLDDIEDNGFAGTIEVAHNVITDACQDDILDTEALRVRDLVNSDVTVHHNVVDGTVDGTNDHHGIRVTAAQGVKVYNNTVYGCDNGFYLDDSVAVRAASADLQNNISSGNRGDAIALVDSSTVVAENDNCFFGTATGITIDATSINTDPLFVAANFSRFELPSGSPCAGTGAIIAGITDGFVGSGPNMGALGVAAADTLKADTADTLTAGFDSSDFAAGTKSSGTYTPAASDGNFQVATNGGAHTIAPPSTSCSIVVHYTNNGTAGAITTSGFTAVTGDSFTTTDTHEFVCVLTKINDVSVLNVTALQ